MYERAPEDQRVEKNPIVRSRISRIKVEVYNVLTGKLKTLI